MSAPEATFNPFRIFDRVVARKFLIRSSKYDEYTEEQLEELVPHSLRTYVIDNETWFLAKDICSFLGITPDHIARYVRKIEDQYVRQEDVVIKTGCATFGAPQKAQTHKLFLVNEPGVYALIQKSKTQYAKEFQAWLNEEVLPTIRKTGSYTAPLNIETERQVISDNMDFEAEVAASVPNEEIEAEFREIIQQKDVIIEAQKVTIDTQKKTIETKTTEHGELMGAHTELMNTLANITKSLEKMQSDNQKFRAESKKASLKSREQIQVLSQDMRKMQDKMDIVIKDKIAKPVDESNLGVLSIFETGEQCLDDREDLRYPYVFCKCQRNTSKQNEKRITDKYPQAKKIFSINNPSADTLFKALRERIKETQPSIVIKNTSFYFNDDEVDVNHVIHLVEEIERERTNV